MYISLHPRSAFICRRVIQVFSWHQQKKKHALCESHAVNHFFFLVAFVEGKKSRGPFQQFLVQCNDSRYKVALRDEVPGNDVDGAKFRAGHLLRHPAHQHGVGGHHQVLQGLCRVGADVLQVHRQIDSCHKESSWEHKIYIFYVMQTKRILFFF